MKITVGDKSFTLTEAEVKALEYDIYEIADWVKNVLRDKARKVMDRLVEEHTDKQPKKLAKDEKELIVKGLSIKSAKQRMAEMESN